MRRKDRELDMPSQLQIIDRCKVLRIAMKDEQGLYIIPLNYGYSYEEEKLIFYVHSAKEGRKIKALKENPELAFELDTDHYLVTGQRSCDYGFLYSCVTGTGTARFVKDEEEKLFALQSLMSHQTKKFKTYVTGIDDGANRHFEFSQAMINAVEVIAIEVNSISGKARDK